MSESARILIVKTSSLGDVVHALPAISDIVAAHPGARIDWVCEEGFAGIPALHPGVTRVIPCAIRRWRRSWLAADTRAEIARFREMLHEAKYAIAIDFQGLIKSACIARNADAVRHGYAWGSAREPLATLAYDRRHRIAWGQHAIARNRQLAAAALGYSLPGPVRYGVVSPPATASGAHCVVVLHSTSRADKLWPEASWREAIGRWSSAGLSIVLPWGDARERERSERLAGGVVAARVPEWMDTPALSALFAGARAVVGVDTGLVHLAVASGASTISIFGPTDPALTGVIADRAPAVNVGGNGAVPDVDDVDAAVQRLLAPPATRRPAWP